MTSLRTKDFLGSTGPFLLLLFAAFYRPSEAKDDPVELIRRHRYVEAIGTWDKDIDLAKIDEKGLRALKGKSLAYFRLGSLFGLYQNFSTEIMAEYYSHQISETGSALHYLYLGQIKFQSSKLQDAKNAFEKAKKIAGAGNPVSEMSEVFLFFTRKRLGEVSGDFTSNQKDNAAQWEAQELKGTRFSDNPNGLALSSQRGRRCKLKILVKSQGTAISDIENSMKLVLDDAQSPETYLDQGKNTQINFYDPFLMQTISEGYYTLSKLTNIRIKEEEKKFPELAAKFNTNLALSESCARLGQWKEAAEYLGIGTDIDKGLLKAQILAHQNKTGEAQVLLETISRSTKNPSDLRDIADCYYLLGFDLDKGLKLASQAVREKNSPNYYRTYANLLFVNTQIDAAMQQYAKGYKIEYRNRIDQIDPEYMVDYAFAIFKTNKLRYEEVVETLYHLQKEFPACRQMHYCMQGISAGLARSFESQRIFRKGG